MEKKYSAKFFRDTMPDWKKKKDPLIARIFYRPISFYISSICANRNISANTVSYFSIGIGLLSCLFFYLSGSVCHIIGALFVNVWLLFDCVDGNIARSVKKQYFGAFADATSCYLLLAFLYPAIGYAVYDEGGLIIEKGNVMIIILGSIATSSDVVLRLIHHKYLEGERLIPDEMKMYKDEESINGEHDPSLRDKMKEAMGIGGYLPVFILIATLLNCLDFIVFYCVIISVLLLIYMTIKMIRKTIFVNRQIYKS